MIEFKHYAKSGLVGSGNYKFRQYHLQTPTPTFSGLTFTCNSSTGSITLNKTGSPSWTGYYNKNNEGWVSYTPGTTGAITLSLGDVLWFKGTLSSDNSFSKFLRFSMSGSISASGNIMSFCSGENFTEVYTLQYDCCFYRLFINCTSLTTAPQLPATTLAYGCYESMFSGCTSLTTAPQLSATSLADYCCWFMFSGCTSLTTAPQLPATSLAYLCYCGMFINCTSLTTAPQLPATSLAYGCYESMFEGCTSLTTAPQLPATTLAIYCYGAMFSGCTSLTTAPQLSATSLADYCYSAMFINCTSLTTLPQLSATALTLGCYGSMFEGCLKIKLSETQDSEYSTPYRIPVSGTGTLASHSLDDMFVSTGGTFTGTPTINTTYYTANTVI